MSLARIKRLVTWAREHGGNMHEKVDVYEDPDFGIALRVRSLSEYEKGTSFPRSTTEESYLPSKSRIVSCPFSISLSYLNALDKFSDLQAHSLHFPTSFFEDLDPHIIGHFFLIQQYLNRELSYWEPYIRSLPQPDEHELLGTALYFSESDLRWIRGTELEAARHQREHTWKSNWKKGIDLLKSSPEWEDRWQECTWDLYKWAATIFSSRSFVSTLFPDEIFRSLSFDRSTRDSTIPSYTTRFSRAQLLSARPYPVLFPLLDLANHSSAANVTWFTNGHIEPKDLTIITENEIAEGHQIFNNYAPKNNTELLLGYGFCIPDNDEVRMIFKNPGEQLMEVRKRHWSSVESHESEKNQDVFHIRRTGYNRPLNERRLSEFTFYEDGCVDALAVLVANDRELTFMAKYPYICPERSLEAVFASPLFRNILLVMFVLHERLQTLHQNIISAGEHLGIPENSRQRAAKVFRDGQISTLQAAIKPLEVRLEAVLLQHTICTHSIKPHLEDSRFAAMQASVELVNLECAFSWLQMTHSTIYNHTIRIIAKELEATIEPSFDWKGLISNDWDFTLWCLWIYVVVVMHLTEDQSHVNGDVVGGWIKLMLEIYNPNSSLSSNSFQNFRGEKDELGTLRSMIDQLQLMLHKEPQIALGDQGETAERLMNLASIIVEEECLKISVGTEGLSGTDRVRQRILCLIKFPDKASKVLWNTTPTNETV